MIEALLSALGPTGTLMAYVDFEPTDAVPHFDVRESPAMTDHGVLAEAIRCWPGAHRSSNPGASMAAIGLQAAWLCKDHPLNYGYGPGSPLAKLVERDGRVLLLGSHLDHVTLLHYAEHLAQLPDKRVVTSKVPTRDGELTIEEFDTSDPVSPALPERFIAELTAAFIDAGHARTGQVGGAHSYLLSAQALTRFAVQRMETDYACLRREG